MTERLRVTSPPERPALRRLRPDPALAARFDFGLDARGQTQLLITLAHEDAALVAAEREAWLRALRSAGYRAFVV